MPDLAQKQISDSPARMGRPPLGQKADDTKPTPVRLEASMRARIAAVLAPGEKLAAFMRTAAEAELQRREGK